MRIRALLAFCGISSLAVSTSALIYYYFVLQRRKTFTHRIDLSSDFCCEDPEEAEVSQETINQTSSVELSNASLSVTFTAGGSPSKQPRMCDESSIVQKKQVETESPAAEQPKQQNTQNKPSSDAVKKVDSWATIVEQSIPNETEILSTNKMYNTVNTPCSQTTNSNSQQKSSRSKKSDKKSRKNKSKEEATPQSNKSHNKKNSDSVQKELLSVLCVNDGTAVPPHMNSAHTQDCQVYLNDPSVISVISPSNVSDADSAVISCGDSIGSYLYNGIPSPSEASSSDSGLRNSPGSPDYFNPPPEEYLSWEVDIPLPIGGKIIGRAGKNVKELRDKTGCKVIIKDLENNRRRQLLIVRGTYEQITKCQTLLQKKFKKDIEFDNGVFYTMEGLPGVVGYPMLPSPPLPTPGAVIPANTYLQLPQCAYFDVLVCNIQTAGHFFLQQPTHSSFFNLNRLHRCMAACYGPSVPELPSPIALGTICAALLEGDSWCRAQVVDVSADESVLTVRCLDVGGYREMTRSNVKQIRTDFLSLPFQATEVFLSEITPTNNEEDFSEEATKFLEQILTTCGTPQAYVKGWNMNDMPLVDLIIRRDGTFVSMAQLLIENGFAVPLEMSTIM